MSFNDRHNPFPKYQNIKSYTEEIIIYMKTYNFTLF